MNILITGASGFVGSHLCNFFEAKGISYTAVVRHPINCLKNAKLIVEQISSDTNWEQSLKGIDAVIHLAGRAHVMNDLSKESFRNYASINIDATINLATQAAIHGVKRFVFISSIGVNCNCSEFALNEGLKPDPKGYYALSKKIAEEELREIALNTNLEVVIIRPPLVYGSGVKANFKKLIEISRTKLPLPFGAVHNKRSLIYVENLIDFILLCTTHPKAANETFLISDDEIVSTKDLLVSLAEAQNKKLLLLPIPLGLLKLLFRMFGKHILYTKVCGSLFLDMTKAKSLLGWKPPYSFKQGIAKTIQSEVD
jgi:nucleoside-diphosphate-sugar epimerase